MILDGTALAKSWNQALALEARGARARPPGLAVVLVGDDPASAVYMRSKARSRASRASPPAIDLPADTPLRPSWSRSSRLNADDAVDGILVQLPLPATSTSSSSRASTPQGRRRALTANVGHSPGPAGHRAVHAARVHAPACATPRWTLGGPRAVVIGRSNLVGQADGDCCSARERDGHDAHSRARAISPRWCGAPELVVAAVGRPELGARRLDADGAIGDRRRHEPHRRRQAHRRRGSTEGPPSARAITPVPGGVGPMTIAMLMANTYRAAVGRRPAS